MKKLTVVIGGVNSGKTTIGAMSYKTLSGLIPFLQLR
jgi:predicted ABC-type ATPase